MAHRLVVHCKHKPYDVYVGRPSKWGNPFRIIGSFTREDVIAAYEEWLRSQPHLVAMAKRELKGKVLGCWCAPLPCHGEVLARIANEE
jgi:hypothetical protein